MCEYESLDSLVLKAFQISGAQAYELFGKSKEYGWSPSGDFNLLICVAQYIESRSSFSFSRDLDLKSWVVMENGFIQYRKEFDGNLEALALAYCLVWADVKLNENCKGPP